MDVKPAGVGGSSESAGTKKTTILPMTPPLRKDKHNLNYVVRSGLAGGLAGCAVGASIIRYVKEYPVLIKSLI